MTLRTFFGRFAPFGFACLAGCIDGRLDVLEPLASGGSSGSAGTQTGGTAGNVATGGTSAASGTGAAGSSGAGGSELPSPFVLDDFEDGDTQSLSIPEGYWYFEPDPTCSGSFVIETTAGHPDMTHAIRARGGGCTDWGALLGLDLGGTAPGDSFDASSFDALRLWARAEPGSVAELSVSLMDPQHFDTVIEVSAEWQEFVLPLDGFMFNDQGPEPPYDVSRFTHLQFFVFSPESFDFWLDDIAFVRSE
jgi:hypothetical protein